MKKFYFLVFLMAFAITTVLVADNGNIFSDFPDKSLTLRNDDPGQSQPDSMLYYNYKGELTQKVIYEYKNGLDYESTSLIYYILNNRGEWYIALKRESIVRDNGRSVKEAKYMFSEDNLLIGGEKKFYKYNAERKLIEEIKSVWKRKSKDVGEWEAQTKSVYDYDNDKNQIHHYYYNWNSFLSEWIGIYKLTTGYDEHNNLILRLSYTWDNNWKKADREEFVYFYNDKEKIDHVELNWYNRDDEIYYSAKKVNIYEDGSDNIAQVDTYVWDEDKNDWDYSSRSMISYDDKNREVNSEIFTWFEDKNEWILTAKRIKDFNSTGKNTFVEEYYYDDFLQQFIGSKKNIFDFDDAGNMISFESYNWDRTNNKWKNWAKTIYTFDSEGRLIVQESHTWNNSISEYEPDGKDVYYYPSPMSITPDQTDSGKVYFSDGTLIINTPAAEYVAVYSVSGAMVYRAFKTEGELSVDLPVLPKGLYIVKGGSGWSAKIIR